MIINGKYFSCNVSLKMPIYFFNISNLILLLYRATAECPKGLFQVGNSRQCYQLFSDKRRNWFDAKALCEANNMVLAEPEDPVAVTSALVKDYGMLNSSSNVLHSHSDDLVAHICPDENFCYFNQKK